MPHTVRFEPWGTAVECSADQSLLDAARLAEIPVGAVCSGRGTCGKCQVRILTEPAPPPVGTETAVVAAGALEQGYRLACMHKVDRDLTVEILPIISHGKGEAPPLERSFELAPSVRRLEVTLEPPSLDRPIADGDNLLAALAEAGQTDVAEIDYRTAQILPETLRAADWHVAVSIRSSPSGVEQSGGGGRGTMRPAEASTPEQRAVPGTTGEVIGVRAATHAAPPLGLAVDLGTTNVATYLYNLNDGALLGVFGAANPLASYGADILSRLMYAGRSPENGGRLQRTLVKALNLLIEHATKTTGCTPADVEEMTVVGNSGMHHLFLNLPPGQLIHAPYVPALRRGMALKARELGIAIAPGGYVYAPPLVGGFVGSDLLAVALATRIDRKPGVRLALDIGTNTELLLSVDGRLFSCSTASGPALEGAALRFGSVAAAGVVDRVWLTRATALSATAPFAASRRSGSAVRALSRRWLAWRRQEFSTRRAGFRPANRACPRDRMATAVSRWRPRDATGLGEDLTISQHDVRAIQLAKGAIRGGLATLLAEHGLSEADLDELLVAGAFGNHIGVEAAQAIGLYPAIPRERIRQIGNAAGTGAGLMLLSTRERQDAEELSEQIRYLELARHKRFIRLFADGQRFPVT